MRTSLRYPHRHRVRLVFVLPAVVAVVCLLVSRRHVASVGGRYEYALEDFAGEVVSAGDIQVSPPGMAEVSEVRMREDGVPVVTFDARQDGEGQALVALDQGGMSFQLNVREGVVFADAVEFSGWEYVEASLILVAGLTGAVCVWAFLRMLRDAWFGYEMAAYAGAGLFFCVQAAGLAHFALSGSARSFSDLAVYITSVADRFVELTVWPVAAAAAVVAASNVALMRHEGRSPLNALGVLFSLALALACLVWRWVSGRALEAMDPQAMLALMLAGSLVAVAISFGLALLVGVCLTAWLAARHTPSLPRDYVAILGCGLMPDGSPTPLLAGRIEAARALATRQAGEGCTLPTLVPSGGQGADEPWSEAEAMVRYLAACSDPCRVLPEGRSANTRENLAFSREVIEADARERGADPAGLRIAFATTNYHVLRGYVYARAAGIAAEGVSSPTRLYFWPNAFLREFVGLLAARALPILGALACVEALYALAFYVTLLAGA